MPVTKDQKNIKGTGRQKGNEKISTAAIVKMAPDAGKKNFLDIAALIRSIQRAEGQTDCFQKGMLDCDRSECKWRTFCL